MKKILCCSYLIYFISLFSFSQNVGIGTATPNASAALEVQSSNKGMLVPRITLTAANVASPVSSPADALLVYNLATAGSGSNAVSPGFYYWSVTVSRWIAVGSGKISDNVGYGGWGDCSANNVSEYNPVVDTSGATGNYFGYSVSVSGNYAIIGEPLEDIGINTDQGSASIFQFNGSNWVMMQKLTDATGQAGDGFGLSVAISGNYAIVGEPLDDIGANADQGSASIYQLSGGTWVLVNKITDPAGASIDLFGRAVSISGNNAIAGSPQYNGVAGADQGAACIFKYNGVNWVFTGKYTDAAGGAGDQFGYAVSISGNYAMIGAYLDDEPNADKGSASIFQFNGSNWVLMNKITDAVPGTNTYFGYSVSLSGNYAIVGIYGYSGPAGAGQGAASIYQFDGSNWIFMSRLLNTAPAASDNFGYSVCMSGNYAIVGAYADSGPGGTNQGSATIYQKIGLGWAKLQYIMDPAGNAVETFGCTISIDAASKRFLIGAVLYANGSGKALFGKIN